MSGRTGGQQQPRLVIALGGRRDSATPDKIARGVTPDVEFEHILASGAATVFDFRSLDGTWLRRRLERLLGPYWAAAFVSVREHSGSTTLLASGEDLGFRMVIADGLFRPRGRRPTITMICHGSFLRSSRASSVVRLLHSRQDVKFLCLSRSIARQFQEVYGIDEQRIDVVGYGVDTNFFRAEELTDEQRAATPRIVSAGLASRDYASLIEAVRGLEVELKVAADSTWFRVSDDIDRAGLPSNVEVRSYGDYLGLRDLYSTAAFVVVPLQQVRHAAGYAVIVEAMAMGKAVISTDVIGRSDLVANNETGILVPPGDVEALRAAIRLLLDDPELTAEMGARARTFVEDNVPIQRYANTIVSSALGLLQDRIS